MSDMKINRYSVPSAIPSPIEAAKTNSRIAARILSPVGTTESFSLSKAYSFTKQTLGDLSYLVRRVVTQDLSNKVNVYASNRLPHTQVTAAPSSRVYSNTSLFPPAIGQVVARTITT